jgi:aryl-alcohol dehydrogenase-like predicted oxidoreductase
MEYRRLGKSDVNVSELILGTWAIGGWLWGGTDDDAAVAAIHKAIDIGMTSIDTAPAYGFGHAEKIIGKAIAGRRDEVQILTKFGIRWDTDVNSEHFLTEDADGNPVLLRHNSTADSIVEECERSLRRLGTDYIDLYQCHWPDRDTPYEETAEATAKLMKQGKVLASGVSNFPPEMMQRYSSRVQLASNQPPYSMLQRNIEEDVVPFCIENDVALIVYSPLQRGILSGKVPMDRTFPDTDARSKLAIYKPESRRRVLDFLDRIKPIADGHNATLAQLVLNWTIHRPGITAALSGARNPEQVEENARAASFELTEEETATINAELDHLELDL